MMEDKTVVRALRIFSMEIYGVSDISQALVTNNLYIFFSKEGYDEK
jgi:hypothetical protein